MKKGLTLRAFVQALTHFLDGTNGRHDDDQVVIPLAEPSIGYTAIEHLSGGFDWDSGKLFLRPTGGLIRAVQISREEMKTLARDRAAWTAKHGDFHHKKEDVYAEAFYEGMKIGMLKLIDENEKESKD